MGVKRTRGRVVGVAGRVKLAVDIPQSDAAVGGARGKQVPLARPCQRPDVRLRWPRGKQTGEEEALVCWQREVTAGVGYPFSAHATSTQTHPCQQTNTPHPPHPLHPTWCPVMVLRTRPVAMSQILTDVSSPADARYLPSGENATVCTVLRCPVNSRTHLPAPPQPRVASAKA